MRGKGYSLWLMPSGQTLDHLSRAIDSLAEKFGTQRFEPHITLVGLVEKPEAEMRLHTRKLTESLQAYSISLRGIDFEDYYFRAIYLKAERSTKVLLAHEAAKREFGLLRGNYMPHLSLLYAALSNDLKQDIISELGSSLDYEFEAVGITLVYTQGEVREWKIIENYPFSVAPPGFSG